jgi:transcriptional regulator NrdR family protein
VELAKEKYEKEEISRGVTAKKAKDLIESEHFKEAIAEIEALQQTQEIGVTSEALKEQAIENLINRERNRAAKLFLKAKHVHDPSKKKEYLLSAKEILNGLISEYPSSPLHEKLVSNLDRVSEALDELQGSVE